MPGLPKDHHTERVKWTAEKPDTIEAESDDQEASVRPTEYGVNLLNTFLSACQNGAWTSMAFYYIEVSHFPALNE